MEKYFLKVLFCLSLIFHNGFSQDIKAIAYLKTDQVNGVITFTQMSSGVHVSGRIEGLPEGRYGFHIHEIGDISTCEAAGSHFNPADTLHGGPDNTMRHVGDLGNIEFTGNEAILNFHDDVIALSGRNSIIGRTLILHGGEDDLGQGGDEESLKTGNAGTRVACAVIGVLEPVYE